jgi:flagellar basal-body rod protein FlgF
MSRGLYVALSGAVAQEQALETTAQNLANANTSGYQRMRPVFREVLAGAKKKENLRYAAVAQTAVDQTRGAIKQTGRGLDVVLPQGNYLAVSTPRGERYTRAGSIAMGVDGILRTAGGTPLAREDGQPLKISAEGGEPSIAADGSVMQNGEVVGKLKMIKGDTGTTFVHEGNGVSTARGAVIKGEGDLELGVVEESNATPVAAMTDLVTATRTFEAFQKMLDTFGECDRKVLTTTPTATE